VELSTRTTKGCTVFSGVRPATAAIAMAARMLATIATNQAIRTERSALIKRSWSKRRALSK